MTPDRGAIVRACLGAYVSGDRSVLEEHLADDVVRLIDTGDEVVVTYEATKTDGRRFRNTEVFTFAGPRISRVDRVHLPDTMSTKCTPMNRASGDAASDVILATD